MGYRDYDDMTSREERRRGQKGSSVGIAAAICILLCLLVLLISILVSTGHDNSSNITSGEIAIEDVPEEAKELAVGAVNDDSISVSFSEEAHVEEEIPLAEESNADTGVDEAMTGNVYDIPQNLEEQSSLTGIANGIHQKAIEAFKVLAEPMENETESEIGNNTPEPTDKNMAIETSTGERESINDVLAKEKIAPSDIEGVSISELTATEEATESPMKTIEVPSTVEEPVISKLISEPKDADKELGVKESIEAGVGEDIIAEPTEIASFDSNVSDTFEAEGAMGSIDNEYQVGNGYFDNVASSEVEEGTGNETVIQEPVSEIIASRAIDTYGVTMSLDDSNTLVINLPEYISYKNAIAIGMKLQRSYGYKVKAKRNTLSISFDNSLSKAEIDMLFDRLSSTLGAEIRRIK